MLSKLCENKIPLAAQIKVLEPLVCALKAAQTRDEKVQILLKGMESPPLKRDLVSLALATIGQEVRADLEPVEKFYAPIGGIVGYHLAFLKLLRKREIEQASILPAESIQEADLETSLKSLAHLGEMYPMGGLATRLDFRDVSGKVLPAALLPFGGRTLLEGLIRDVEAREQLYAKVFGKKITIPLALMTSDENQECLEELCENKRWFGREKESFFLFPQLSVPLLSAEGEWSSPLQMQPNGHGAIWQTALEAGVFEWFKKQGKQDLLIRQINNPIAGLDDLLLTFVGSGQGYTFGFVGCEREPKAAEGILARVKKEEKEHLSNIEYTDFEHYGIQKGDAYPANTNILYANLEKLLPAVQQNFLPGLMLNLKAEAGGRLESTMQSISDTLDVEETFLFQRPRKQTIASTKRKYEGELLETPEGAFQVLMENNLELLKRCGFTVENALFCYQPALGPLYQIISQKLRGGRLAQGAELQIECPEILIENLDLEGSLLIEGEGFCQIQGLVVRNQGMSGGCYWKNQIKRIQALRLQVEGELIIQDVILEGEKHFFVPKDEQWIVTSKGVTKQSRQGLQWEYQLKAQQVALSCHRSS